MLPLNDLCDLAISIAYLYINRDIKLNYGTVIEEFVPFNCHLSFV